MFFKIKNQEYTFRFTSNYQQQQQERQEWFAWYENRLQEWGVDIHNNVYFNQQNNNQQQQDSDDMDDPQNMAGNHIGNQGHNNHDPAAVGGQGQGGPDNEYVPNPAALVGQHLGKYIIFSKNKIKK